MPSEAIEPLSSDDVLPANDALLPALALESGIFAAASPNDLQALVDAPCRTLEVEYKSWRNLSNSEDRAELARDIAALANHGGGYVIFGFHQDSLAAEDTYPFRTSCTTEQVAAIVRTYLDPPVACEVTLLRSAAGNPHPVIRVAGHGPVPTCVRQDGPLVGSTRLIECGAYYTRRHKIPARGSFAGVPLPESARIATPLEWAPLIRRCVRQDREALLALIDGAIEGRKTTPLLAHRLEAWHAAAHAAFLAVAPLSPVAEQLRRRHYALSYGFDVAGQEMLEPAQLPELLRRAVFELQPTFRGVLNMFDPPYRRAVKPRYAADDATGDGETEFLEVAWLRDRPPGETADFWRLSPRGLATIVRDYAEDRSAENLQFELHPGTWFSPNVLARELAELVCHARALLRFFNSARKVRFRCEWWGLAGREVFDPGARWAHRGSAMDDHRVASLEVPAAALANGWADVAAQLMAPVLRAFDPDIALGAEWVRAQLSPPAT